MAFRIFPTFFLIAFVLSFLGCKNGGGVTLLAAVQVRIPPAPPNTTIVPKPTQSIGISSPMAAFSPTDDAKDGFFDTFITPTTFAIGLKSAALVPTSTVNPVNYMIFDTHDANNPTIIYLDSNNTQTIFHNPGTLAPGSYGTVQFEVVFFEMIVPVYDGNGNPHPRRFRYYLSTSSDPQLRQVGPPQNQSASPNDILVSASDNGFDFRWISTLNGSLNANRSAIGTATGSSTLAGTVYQIPTGQQTLCTAGSGVGNSPCLVTVPVTINLSSGDNKNQQITLIFDVTNTFFYDETDSTPGNPNSSNSGFFDPATLTTKPNPPNPRFNYLAPQPFSSSVPPAAGQSRDGSIDAACTVAPPSCTNSASFWPGPPAITASYAEK